MNIQVEQGDELLIGFIDESFEALQQLSAELDRYRLDPANTEAIHSVFRAVHTIKGNAGFFGLIGLNKFAHALENTLDDVRNGEVALNEQLQQALVEGFDALAASLESASDGDLRDDIDEDEAALLVQVAELANQCRCEQSPEVRLLQQIRDLAEEIEKADLPQSMDWGRRLLSFVSEQDEDEVEPSAETPLVAPASSFVGIACRAAGEDVSSRVADLLELFLHTERGEYEKSIGKAFLDSAEQFAEWSEKTHQASLTDALRTAISDFTTFYNSPLDFDTTLMSIVWDPLAVELSKLVADQEQWNDGDQEPTPDVKQESGPSPDSADGERAKARFLRVKEEYLDQFLDDVSGLFVTCERLKALQARMSTETPEELADRLRQINATLTSQTNELQESVVGLRKVPVRGLFAKFPRLARGLAAKLDKKIKVHLEGEETEIDKMLVEDLDGPLTHMVRNVVDHGIEAPEERIARCVDEVGNLWLKASLTRTHLVIAVEDDGRGIDAERLRLKAVEKGIYSQGQVDGMTDNEAIHLIFHPGFSTAEKISDVSGRGVGLDVVRTTLLDHGGDVNVESKVGQGTKFRFEIPLRKAVLVIDGLLVQQNDEKFVLPFEHIREIVELDQRDLKPVQGSLVATIHGNHFPATSLGRLLGLDENQEQATQQTHGVLLACNDGQMCLMVDQVVGRHKVVVKDLNDILPGVENFSGVAEVHGGQLALVLSAPALIHTLSEPTSGGQNSRCGRQPST